MTKDFSEALVLGQSAKRLVETIDAIWKHAEGQGRRDLTYQDDFSELQYLYGFMVSVYLGRLR